MKVGTRRGGGDEGTRRRIIKVWKRGHCGNLASWRVSVGHQNRNKNITNLETRDPLTQQMGQPLSFAIPSIPLRYSYGSARKCFHVFPPYRLRGLAFCGHISHITLTHQQASMTYLSMFHVVEGWRADLHLDFLDD